MASHYYGVAEIPISKLNFDFRQDFKRRRNSKQVSQLERIFTDEKCNNEGILNAIDARVSKSALLSALRKRNLDETSLTSRPNQPIERLDLQVDCLHGLHRVEAAKIHLRDLPLDKQFWTVHLYDDSISPNDEISLIEQHGNENDFEDGYMMRKILLYDRAIRLGIYTSCPNLGKDGCISAKVKWWGRLEKKGPSKATDLRQILKDPRFRQAFYDLLDIPGLWEDLKLGTLHRFIGIKCQEEILRYLDHIKKVWFCITTLVWAVDFATVHELQSRCPRISPVDDGTIQEAMLQKKIFSSIQSQTERNTILSNVRRIPFLIPSIKTLFENLKYLEPCSNILKDLAKYEWKQAESSEQAESLEQCYYRHYLRPERLKVYGPNGYSTCVAPNNITAFRLAYFQLWLFCLANFPRLTSSTCRKEPGKLKPKTTDPNPRMLYELGKRVTDQGFQLKEAKRLKESDPYCEIAKRSILAAHPEVVNPSSSSVNDIARRIKLEGMAEMHGKAAAISPKPVSIRRRVGVPYNDDFEADRGLLFLENIAIQPETCSTLFVKRDLVLSFFGHDIFSIIQQLPTRQEVDIEDLMEISQNDETGRLNSQLLSKEKELEASMSELRNEKAKFEASKVQQRKANDTITSLKSQITLEKKTSDSLKAEIRTQQQAKDALERDFQQANQMMTASNSALSNGKNESITLRAQIVHIQATQKDKLEAAQEKYVAQSKTIEDLRARIVKLKESSNKQVIQLQAEVKTVKESLIQLQNSSQKTIADLEQAQKNAEEDSRVIEERGLREDADINILKYDYEQQTVQINDLKKKEEKANKDAEDQKYDYEQQTVQINDLKKKQEKAKKDAEDQKYDYEQQTVQINDLKKKEEKANKDAEDQNLQLQKSKQEATKEIEKLESLLKLSSETTFQGINHNMSVQEVQKEIEVLRKQQKLPFQISDAIQSSRDCAFQYTHDPSVVGTGTNRYLLTYMIYGGKEDAVDWLNGFESLFSSVKDLQFSTLLGTTINCGKSRISNSILDPHSLKSGTPDNTNLGVHQLLFYQQNPQE